MTMTRRSLITAGLSAPVLATLAACQGSDTAEQVADADPAAGGSWPRTVPGEDGEVEIASEPQRIACVSTDMADVVLALIGSERVVLVPDTCTDPHFSLHAEEAGAVETVLDAETMGDPEQILATDPDLVLITTRHESETDVNAQLTGAGVTVVALASEWENEDVFVENVELIAHAIGADEEGEGLVADYRDRWSAVVDAISDVDESERPVIGQIRTLGGDVWMSGPGTMGERLCEVLGSETLTSLMGLDQGAAVDIEGIVAADPDALVFVHSTGGGLDQFREVLDNPAMLDVRAVADERTPLVTAAEVATGTGALVALETIGAALYPDLVPEA